MSDLVFINGGANVFQRSYIFITKTRLNFDFQIAIVFVLSLLLNVTCVTANIISSNKIRSPYQKKKKLVSILR